VSFIIPDWKEYFTPEDIGRTVMVQRYHSLEVVVLEKNSKTFALKGEECFAGRFPSGITFQFHPESVGTSCQDIFFGVIERFFHQLI
jgi:anthranilate/para-aminobenzoate synthase component II